MNRARDNDEQMLSRRLDHLEADDDRLADALSTSHLVRLVPNLTTTPS